MTRRARVARRLRDKAAIEADLLGLRVRHGRTLAPRADGGPVALFASLSQYIYQLKLEGMLAKALELEGYTPVFLVPSNAPLARRYLRAFGVRRFVELAEYAGSQAEAPADAARLRELVRADPSASELAALTFRGAAIGRYVVSTASRFRHEGTVDFADPAARATLEELLDVATRSTLAAERLLDRLRPDAMVFNERNYASEAPLSDLALERGLNVIQFVAGFRDDELVFKRYTHETRRFHPRSLSDASWARVKALPWTPGREAALDEEQRGRYDNANALARRRQGWAREWAAEDIRAHLGLDPEKKTAVVFSHILWDANMFYGEDLFADQQDWFVSTVRAAYANASVDWVVKLHPDNVWKRRRDGVTGELGELALIREHVGPLPAHVKLLRPETPISTRSLFELTDYGITIRGSVGVELPCLGIPVLTAGTGYYAGRGFTIDSSSREEYLGRLARIEEIPPLGREQVELARRHAYALFCLRPTRFTSFGTVIRPVERMGTPLDHNLVVNVRSRAALERAADLRRFADWAVRSEELDYMNWDAA